MHVNKEDTQRSTWWWCIWLSSRAAPNTACSCESAFATRTIVHIPAHNTETEKKTHTHTHTHKMMMKMMIMMRRELNIKKEWTVISTKDNE